MPQWFYVAVLNGSSSDSFATPKQYGQGYCIGLLCPVMGDLVSVYSIIAVNPEAAKKRIFDESVSEKVDEFRYPKQVESGSLG
jgi:hypothetical protein